MDRASDPRHQFHRALHNGSLEDALRFAGSLPVSMDEAARLVALAGRDRAPSFDRMAVRFLTILLDEREMSLRDVRWVLGRMRDAREGHWRESERALRRFVASSLRRAGRSNTVRLPDDPALPRWSCLPV